MQVKAALVWWLVTEREHPGLVREETTVQALMPLVNCMFPGINFYSATGFATVARLYVMPALRKQHSNLLALQAAQVSADAMVEVSEVLPSEGYQWQTDPGWADRFRVYMAA
jgi:hypothetical protein